MIASHLATSSSTETAQSARRTASRKAPPHLLPPAVRVQRCLLCRRLAPGARVGDPPLSRVGVELYVRADRRSPSPTSTSCRRKASPAIRRRADEVLQRRIGTCGRGRAAAAQDADPLPRQLPLLAPRVRETISSGGQARVAPGRTLSPRPLDRDQPDPTQQGSQVLISAEGPQSSG
jgi:hypothetical protein